MIINTRIRLALHRLKNGVIAHPTDTIYGLGCLANNPAGIKKIIELKKRDINKGFIPVSYTHLTLPTNREV